MEKELPSKKKKNHIEKKKKKEGYFSAQNSIDAFWVCLFLRKIKTEQVSHFTKSLPLLLNPKGIKI